MMSLRTLCKLPFHYSVGTFARRNSNLGPCARLARTVFSEYEYYKYPLQITAANYSQNWNDNNKRFYRSKYAVKTIGTAIFAAAARRESEQQPANKMHAFCMNTIQLLSNPALTKKEKLAIIEAHAKNGGPMNSFPLGDSHSSFLSYLFCAIEKNDSDAYDMICAAFKCGTKIDYQDWPSDSPINEALSSKMSLSGKIGVINALVENGYNINYRSSSPGFLSNGNSSLLFVLSDSFHTPDNELMPLMNEMYALNANFFENERPFHHALSRSQSVEWKICAVDALLSINAKINVKDTNGRSPLGIVLKTAIRYHTTQDGMSDQIKLFKKLKEHGAVLPTQHEKENLHKELAQNIEERELEKNRLIAKVREHSKNAIEGSSRALLEFTMGINGENTAVYGMHNSYKIHYERQLKDTNKHLETLLEIGKMIEQE